MAKTKQFFSRFKPEKCCRNKEKVIRKPQKVIERKSHLVIFKRNLPETFINAYKNI
jgi:hypothetical protein